MGTKVSNRSYFHRVGVTKGNASTAFASAETNASRNTRAREEMIPRHTFAVARKRRDAATIQEEAHGKPTVKSIVSLGLHAD